MGKAIPITLGPRHFKTKSQASDFFKQMLNGYDLHSKVSLSDSVYLEALLAHHPDKSEKIGVGVKCFSVELQPEGTACFCLHRTDGSKARFSYPHCITNAS